MALISSTVFQWLVDKILDPLLSWAFPTAAGYLMSRWFNKHLFIDDIITTISDRKVVFDVRVSNVSDQALSLTNLHCKIFNPSVPETFYRNAVQNSSATYEVYSKDEKLITKIGNEEFFDFSSFESKGNFIFQSKLMQVISPKETDRFKFVIHLGVPLSNVEMKNVEASIIYAYQGKSKTTKW